MDSLRNMAGGPKEEESPYWARTPFQTTMNDFLWFASGQLAQRFFLVIPGNGRG